MFARPRSPPRGATAGPSTSTNADDDDNDNTSADFDFDLRASAARDSSIDSALHYVHEAYEYVQRRVQRQIDAATAINALNNTSIPGDSSTKTAFYTLLNRKQQRRLFLHTSRSETAWPRLRPLFGAPPYDFLHSEDASGFRAGGIAKRRANMAHDTEKIIPNYNQFGAGHFADNAGRLYNAVALDGSDKDTDDGARLPWTDAALRDAVRIVMLIKIPKRGAAKLRVPSSKKDRVLFPTPGQTIRLQMTSVLDRLSNPSRRQPFSLRRATSELPAINVRIHTISLRAMQASTAILSATIV